MEWLSRHLVRLIVWLNELFGGPVVREVATHELQQWLLVSDNTLSSGQPNAKSCAAKTSAIISKHQPADLNPLPGEAPRPAGPSRQKTILVDVRSTSERAVSMLPGALTRQEFEDRKEDYANCRVVAYCTIGGRSFLFARKLSAQGMPVFNYIDGILGWCQHKGQLEDQDGLPTDRVHLLTRLYRPPEGYVSARTNSK